MEILKEKDELKDEKKKWYETQVRGYDRRD